MQRIVLAGICGAFVLFGGIAALDTAAEVRAGLASRAWPVTDGEILRAERRRGDKKLKRFEYAYRVEGADYRATRAAFVRIPYGTPLHRAYKAGQTVAVRYDPADPSEAVLEPGAPVLGILSEALVPVLLIGLGGAGLLYGFARR